MDLNRLRYFRVVAETGSIREAAATLHLSPTALSKAVKVLEREAGVALVRPRGRGIVLTDAGRLLALHARAPLETLADLPRMLASSTPPGDALRFASHEVFGTYFLRSVLGHAPSDARIEHRYLQPGAIEAAVRDGESDLGVTYLPLPTQGTVHAHIGDVAMGVFGTSAWREAPIDALEFAAPVLPTIGAPLRAQSLDGWPDDRLPRAVRHRITTTESALELCRQGDAVAVFPHFVVRIHNGSTLRREQLHPVASAALVMQQPQAVHLVRRAGEDEPPQAAWLRASIVELGTRQP